MYSKIIVPIRDDHSSAFYKPGPLPPHVPLLGPFKSDDSIGILLERIRPTIACTAPITAVSRRPEGGLWNHLRSHSYCILEDCQELVGLQREIYRLLTTEGFTLSFQSGTEDVNTYRPRVCGVGRTYLWPGSLVALQRVIVIWAKDPRLDYVTTVAEVPLGTGLMDPTIPHLQLVQ